MKETRTGIGFDIHRFQSGRPLILGGVNIPFEYGLAGHSDADVLLHAITDAVLGTLGIGDIGMLFPDTDPAYKNVDSRKLLRTAMNHLRSNGGKVTWLDANVVAEQPKLSPHRTEIIKSISETMGLPSDRISIKAKTSEGLGFVGRREGIAVQAVVTVRINTE